MISRASTQLMDDVFSDLQTFRPYRINALTIIVPISEGWTKESQLNEIESVCGVDHDLWFEDGGYFRLEHPQI